MEETIAPVSSSKQKARTVKQLNIKEDKKELKEPNRFLVEHFPTQRTQMDSDEENYTITRNNNRNPFNRRLTIFFFSTGEFLQA